MPTIPEQVAPWALGGAWSLVVLGLFLLPALPRPFRRTYPELLLVVLSVLYIAQGARNVAGVTLLAAAYLGMIRLFRRSSDFTPTRRSAIMGLALVLVLAGTILLAYSQLASSGVFGVTVSEKYALQSSGRYGVLVGGRQESVSSLVAIVDSPILGHGSRALGREYIDTAIGLLDDLGYTANRWEGGSIRSHSYVLGAWVSAGMAGLAFWFVVLWMALRGLGNAHTLAAPWMALTVFLSFDLMWNWLFSPFGGRGRTVLPIVLLVLVAADSVARTGPQRAFTRS